MSYRAHSKGNYGSQKHHSRFGSNHKGLKNAKLQEPLPLKRTLYPYIEANRTKPLIEISGQQKRFAMSKSLSDEGDAIIQKIAKEIFAFHPIGRMSEMGIALGGQLPTPKGKEVVTTPVGTYVFKAKSAPNESDVNKWFKMQDDANSLRTKSAEYSFGVERRVNSTIGNFRVIEKGRELRSKGLLSVEEDKTLEVLEDFWESHPKLDRKHGSGIWVSSTKIKPLSD